MKKIILPLALLAGISTAAQAQTAVRIGLKAGANLAGYTGPDNKDTEYKYGFSAGATFNFALSDMMSIQPELLYSQKGMKLDYNGYENSDAGVFASSATIAGTYGQTLSYIDVPVLLRVNTGGSGSTGLFFELGPQGSFLIANRGFIDRGDKATVVLAGSKRNEPQVGDTLPAWATGSSTGDFNKVVIGYVLGVGYQHESGLSLGLRYSGDISQVYKDGNGTSDAVKVYQAIGTRLTNPNVRSSVFQLQAGYVFGDK